MLMKFGMGLGMLAIAAQAWAIVAEWFASRWTFQEDDDDN